MKTGIDCMLGRAQDHRERKPKNKHRCTIADTFWSFKINLIRQGLLKIEDVVAEAIAKLFGAFGSMEGSSSGASGNSEVEGYTGNSPPIAACPIELNFALVSSSQGAGCVKQMDYYTDACINADTPSTANGSQIADNGKETEYTNSPNRLDYNMYIQVNKNPEGTMFKKTILYRLKTALPALMLVGMGLSSCEKDCKYNSDYKENDKECVDPALINSGITIDPTAEKIKQLEQDSVRLAGEVRAAVEPAKKVETDITNFFNAQTAGVVEALNKGSPETLADSAEVFVKVVDTSWERMGKPLPTNEETMSNLRTKSINYLDVIDELKELRSR